MNSHNIETTSTINQFGLVVLVVYLITLNKTLMPKQTPLEKAQELVHKFRDLDDENITDYVSLHSALICVQEIIDSEPAQQKTYEFFVAVQVELNKML